MKKVLLILTIIGFAAVLYGPRAALAYNIDITIQQTAVVAPPNINNISGTVSVSGENPAGPNQVKITQVSAVITQGSASVTAPPTPLPEAAVTYPYNIVLSGFSCTGNATIRVTALLNNGVPHHYEQQAVCSGGGAVPAGPGGSVVSTGGGPLNCCKVGRTTIWKSGTVGGISCTEAPHCTIEKNTLIGESATCGDNTGVKVASQWGIICLLNTLYGIVDWVFIILIALSGIWISLGAYTLITSAGSPEGMTKGRDYVLYAAIGLIVALLVRAIPSVVRMVVGA